MKRITIHPAYIRGILYNIAETTESAQPLQMPAELRQSTFIPMLAKMVMITGGVATVLYLASRIFH